MHPLKIFLDTFKTVVKHSSGGSRGGARWDQASPLFLDQIGARRDEKFFWRPAPPPPPYLRAWMINSQLPYFKLYTVKELVKNHSKIFYNNIMVQ